MSEVPLGEMYSLRNSVKLIRGGASYFKLLLELIKAAEYCIHIQVYLLEEDYTGMLVTKALVKAAKRNVRIYLMVDGFASQGLSKNLIEQFESAGICFRYFEPLWKSSHFYFGRRMHHKVVVVDGNMALVGGINLADRYNDLDGQTAWLDFAIYTEGQAARNLHNFCSKAWKIENEELPASLDLQMNNNEACSVRIRENDWVRGKRQIWKTYFQLFHQARSSITIVCSYFLPGVEFRKQLKGAVARGVRVQVVLAGTSDVIMAKYAERYLYNWLLKHGIEVFEYQPSVLHAKLTIVDRHWVTAGSYNLNNLSAYASKELNLEIRNKPFALLVEREIDRIIIKDCIQITKQNFTMKAGYFKKIFQRISFELIKLACNLSTFYFRQE